MVIRNVHRIRYLTIRFQPTQSHTVQVATICQNKCDKYSESEFRISGRVQHFDLGMAVSAQETTMEAHWKITK